MVKLTKKLKIVMIVFVGALLFSSCTSLNRTIKEPNVRVDLEKEDFTLSDQVSAEAVETRVLGIDWSRLFSTSTGTIEKDGILNLPTIPVIGDVVDGRVNSYALYELMAQNPGYDVVFFPQFETRVERPIGIPFIYQVTTVTATARLGELD